MKNIPIGIITFLNVNNYGAELQAFALNHKLNSLGYDSEIIDYLYHKNPRYVKEELSKPKISASKIRQFKDYILKWIDKLSKLFYPTIAKSRAERFDEFHQKYTKLSKEIRSISTLYNRELPYDVLIAGSDQIWNPGNQTNLDPYFLTFANDGIRKISYASSFGVSSIDPKFHSYYSDRLNNLDYISTRESSGVALIGEIAKRNATHVVDPTLLLSSDEWKQFQTPFPDDAPYILLFVFSNSKYSTELAYEIQRKTGYKIYRICKNEIRIEADSKIVNLRDLGPSEFLGIYSKAAFVVTSSFHGTIFSLIFEKPFYTVIPSGKTNNARQKSLLNLAGLESRLLTEDTPISALSIDLEMDFTHATQILHTEKINSLAYLVNAIED